LASQWEGLPNVVLEAMAAGTPVVATAAEGVRDLLGEGKLGVVVPLSGEPRLPEAIRYALREEELRRERAVKAQSIVREKFTWPQVVSEYEHFYTGILAQLPKDA
jgi:glycosyltransferase involved in cell wall biosynthesis